MAIGQEALYNNTGNNNIAVGNSALYQGTTGSNNVAMGHYAGANITTGNSNIMIGTGITNTVRASSATASYEMNIGNTLFGTGVDSTTGVGKIGINTNAPVASLDVKGSIALNITVLNTAFWTAAGSGTYTVQPNDYQLVIDNCDSVAYSISIPPASQSKGRVLVLYMPNPAVTGSAGVQSIAINTTGSDKFSMPGVLIGMRYSTLGRFVLGSGGIYATLVSDGNNIWYVTQ